jgi:hypothetical protein
MDGLILLSVEELAVNELRETFHHWVRTLVFSVKGGVLGEPLPHRPPTEIAQATVAHGAGHDARARELLGEMEPDLKRFLASHAERLTETLRHELEDAGLQARAQEEERYRSRQGEVSTLIAENTLAKLGREIEKLKTERQQGLLFDEESRLDAIDRSIEEKQAEVARRKRHYEEVRDQLERERTRILGHLLPRRHTMSAVAQIFPVSIEVRLPAT